jgi:hypothetical protein
LFEELNIFKEDLYNSFESIGMMFKWIFSFIILIFRFLKKLITESKGNYTKYIIMPTNLIEAASVKNPTS